MAYYNQNNNQAQDSSLGMNEKKKEDGTALAPASGVQLTQASANGANTSAPSNTIPTAPKSSSSGMGGGFQGYQKANQGVATNRLNAAAQSNVANQGRAAQTGINQATEQFGKKADAGTLANRYQAIQDVSNVVNNARKINAPAASVLPPPPPGAGSNSFGQGGEWKLGETQASRDATAAQFAGQPIVHPTGRAMLQSSGASTTSAPASPSPVSNNNTNITTPAPVPVQAVNDGRMNQPVAAPVSAPVVNPLASLAQNDVSRFQDVINAKYQGPESLRQAGLYQLASGKVAQAANTAKQTKTAQGREEMLRDMYAKRGDYTSGLNKLDSAVLNSSQSGVGALQSAAQAQGDVSQKLDKAQIGSANLSQNRTNEITDIKNQARTVFSEGKTAEEAATEQRIADMTTKPVLDATGKPVMKTDGTPMTEWDKLPENFRAIIANKTKDNAAMLASETAKIKGTTYDGISAQTAAAKSAMDKANMANKMSGLYGADWGAGVTKTPQEIAAYQANAKKAYADSVAAYNGFNTQKSGLDSQISALTQKYNPNATVFNQLEADTLGIKSGEGLYNLGTNTIKSGVAEKDRLVSRDEQARQAVLSQLAGLDKSNQLNTNLNYANADKAGTQSILDSLDLQGTRNNLNAAEQNFEDTAENTDIKGEGKKKVSRGNALGTTTRTYKASMKGNAGDFLKQAGYNFDAPAENGNIAGQKDLLNAALQISKRDDNSKTVERDNANEQLAASGKGAAAGASVGSVVPVIGTAIGALAGSVLGNVVQSGTFDPGQHAQSLMDGYLGQNNFLSQAHRDARNIGGKAAEGYSNVLTGGLGAIGGSKGLSANIGSMVSGVDTKAMAAMGNQVAKQKAAEDLQNKYTGFLKNQGFDNRANVENNSATNLRMNSLEQLLASLDKTNTQK